LNKILVTGSSRGLGLCICENLVKENIVFGLSRSSPRSEILRNNTNFTHLKADISVLSEVEKAFEKIEDLDVIVNCAGIFKTDQFHECSFEEISRIIDVNVKGMLYTTKFALDKMTKNNCKVINISSVSGKYGIENQAIYSATKHAVQGFSDALLKEVMPKGINVSTICPGGIQTSLWNNNNPYEGEYHKILKPKDVSRVVEFIIDTDNSVVFKNIVMFPNNEIH
jgi:3-oxoacyl-[acyl-carrier protein] reductase|tara:strand:+ start:2973 stop:3647 length:675 start_codon:yes stop_codon:yes gene_type:complete